jgi:hypothetical protein
MEGKETKTLIDYGASYAAAALNAMSSLGEGGLDKVAENAANHMNEREKILFKAAEYLGRGIAIGEDNGRQKGLVEGIYKVADYAYAAYGEEIANDIVEAMIETHEEKTAEDDVMGALYALVESGVRDSIIDAYGGEEKLAKLLGEYEGFEEELQEKVGELTTSALESMGIYTEEV